MRILSYGGINDSQSAISPTFSSKHLQNCKCKDVKLQVLANDCTKSDNYDKSALTDAPSQKSSDKLTESSNIGPNDLLEKNTENSQQELESNLLQSKQFEEFHYPHLVNKIGFNGIFKSSIFLLRLLD